MGHHGTSWDIRLLLTSKKTVCTASHSSILSDAPCRVWIGPLRQRCLDAGSLVPICGGRLGLKRSRECLWDPVRSWLRLQGIAAPCGASSLPVSAPGTCGRGESPNAWNNAMLWCSKHVRIPTISSPFKYKFSSLLRMHPKWSEMLVFGNVLSVVQRGVQVVLSSLLSPWRAQRCVPGAGYLRQPLTEDLRLGSLESQLQRHWERIWDRWWSWWSSDVWKISHYFALALE